MGNLEIAIDDISHEKLEDFLDFIAYSAEMMGLVMVGRAYMSDEKEAENAETTGTTTQGKRVRRTRSKKGRYNTTRERVS
jgi:hypothetical protein